MKGFVVSEGPALEGNFVDVFPVRFFVGDPPPRETLLTPENREGVKGVFGVLPTSERVRCLLGVLGCMAVAERDGRKEEMKDSQLARGRAERVFNVTRFTATTAEQSRFLTPMWCSG